MKLVLLSLSLLALALLALSQGAPYSAEHDDFDVEPVLRDPALLKSFSDCFLDKGPCDDIQSHFKKNIPDAVQTACSSCTDKQKHLMRRVLEVLTVQYPDVAEQFTTKYDPEKKYIPALLAAVDKA